MRARSMSFALIFALAGVLAYQSIAAVNAAPQPPVVSGGGQTTSHPVASCGLLSFARRDYHFNSELLVQASGDFNGDGKPDLVGLDYAQHNVGVLLNDGSGGFGAPVTYTLGTYPPIGVAVGDFNGDGKLDIVVSIIDTGGQHNAIMVFLGRGDGTFQPGTSFPIDSYPGPIAVADFNHDGKLDIVTNNPAGTNLFVLLGNGDGTFQPYRYVIVGNVPGPPVTADFNGDGNADIAVPNASSGSVTLLLGNGDGTFQPAANFPVGINPLYAVSGDFNGDGKLDLMVTDGYDSRHARVMLLPGNGRGGFAPATIYYPGYVPGSLAAADFDGDGHVDLALTNTNDNTVTIWRGNGAAGFNPPVGYGVIPSPYLLVVADLNGDGKPDVVTSDDRYPSNMTVLLNTCAPSTATPPTSTPSDTPLPTNPTPTATPCNERFTDINGNPFYNAIQYLYCQRSINGYGNTYNPAGTATRAQFAKVIVLGFGISIYTGGSDFSDVPFSHYAHNYVETGFYAGIFKGFDAATCAANGATYPCFLPERLITRGELTKMVVLTGFFPLTTPGTPTFSDVPPSNPFYPYIETAYAQHIISGYPDGTFRPNQNIRRDQMAGIVYNGIVNPNWGLAGKAAHHRP